MCAENGLRVKPCHETHHCHTVPVEKNAEEDKGHDGEQVVRGRLLGVSCASQSHVRSLVGPHDGESDEEGEDLNDGATRDGEKRGVRGNRVAVEDEVRVAHVVEKAAEDVGKDDKPVLRERKRNRTEKGRK